MRRLPHIVSALGLLLTSMPGIAQRTYEDCIDLVVKSAKFKEALELGRSNCFNRFIQPEFDRRYLAAAQQKYVEASKIDSVNLNCQVLDELKTTARLSCVIPGKTEYIYSIKLRTTLDDGSIKIFELKNDLERDPRDNTFKWGDALTVGIFREKQRIKTYDRLSLEIKWVN